MSDLKISKSAMDMANTWYRGDDCPEELVRQLACQVQLAINGACLPLVAALRFYADAGNWENDRADYGSTSVPVPGTSPVQNITNQCALEALAAHRKEHG